MADFGLYAELKTSHYVVIILAQMQSVNRR